MSSRNAKWLIVMMSLVTATIANAAPTIDNSDPKPALRSVSRATTEESSSLPQEALFSGTTDSSLAKIADELLKPPANSTVLSALPPGTRTLPAVPAALFMCLTGFLCITFVRDRKVWLAAAATLLWAGQAGITALPQIASHLISKRQFEQQTNSKLIYVSELQNVDRLRSDLDGTRYIGLLHHLEGIPPAKRNTILDSGFSMLVSRKAGSLDEYRVSSIKYQVSRIKQPSSQSAIAIFSPYAIPALKCLAFEVRQFTSFSPAFIFESLPRGPPISL